MRAVKTQHRKGERPMAKRYAKKYRRRNQEDYPDDSGLVELDRIARRDPDPVRRAAYREAAREARASRVR